MDKQGIDRRWSAAGSTCSATSCRRPKARPGARLINEAQLAVAKAEPRFVPLATVPLQDGARAAAVLQDAPSRPAFPALMIGTLPRGIGSVLDAADLDPFWQAADETGAIIHIHPSFDAGDVRVNDFGLANGVGRITDAIVAVARLICARPCHALHATPRSSCRSAPPALPFVIGRLARNFADHARDRRSGGRRWRCIYTDTIVHDPRVLRFVVEMIGADRVMMGSDMPFPIGDKEPMKYRDRGRFDGRSGRVDQW